MNKVIVICGPTASGKTDLSIKLAKRFNCEIICVDSRTVYKHLNIGTAKPYIDRSHKLLSKDKILGPVYKIDGIVHYGLDLVNPKKRYSVAEFQQFAYSAIKKIIAKGKTPFFVGGTGLYIDAVVKGFSFPKEDLQLRAKIEKMSDREIEYKMLKYDPATLKKYINNRRRLERALEVYLLNQRPISEYKKDQPDFNCLFLAVDWPREELYQRIDKWVDMRIKMGMIDEVKSLIKKGLSHKRLQEFGLEYRFIDNYLQNPTNKNLKFQIINLKFKTHAFARRQLTWFRRNKEINWLKADNKLQKNADKLVKKFLL